MKKLLIVSIIMIVLCPYDLFAYSLNYNPSLRTSVTWDDNILDSSTDEKSDVFLSIDPRLVIDGKGDRSSFRLEGRVSGELYSEFEEFNEISTYRVNGSYDYNFSDIFRFGLSSWFIFTPTAETEREAVIIAGGEGDIPVTTEITRRADRYRYSVSPEITYFFTPRLSTTLGGGIRATEYTEEFADVSDSFIYNGSGEVRYAFTRKTSGGVKLSFSDTDYDVGDDSRVYTSALTARHKYSKNVDFSASGGVSYLTQDNADSEFGFVGSAGSTFRYQKGRLDLNVSRSIQESSFGETTTRDFAGAIMTVPFLRNMKMRVRGNVSRHESSDGDQDLLIMRGSISLDYQALTNLELFISGSTEDQDERAAVGEDIQINRLSAGFVIRARFEEGSIYR